MKKLYLVRHAKSSWKDRSLSDQQRPLNQRGLKNAPEMGRRLAKAGVTIDQIISSPANRAFTTASILARKIGYEEDRIQINDDLYFNGLSSMLGIIQHTKPGLQNLMLVGHNPDMSSMINSLCNDQVDNVPTCAIAVIEFDSNWSKVIYHSGNLVSYDYPRKTFTIL